MWWKGKIAKTCGLLTLVACLFASWVVQAQDAGPGNRDVQGESLPVPEPKEGAVSEAINSALSEFNSVLVEVLFFDVSGGAITVDVVDREGRVTLDETGQPKKKTVSIPFIVVVLAGGAIFFTVWYKFINVRGFRHAVDIVRGKFDRPEDVGDISHFRALTSALSATVGLGNIAGVAIAIQLGGPGAVFWMMVTAFFGMAAKFSSCTLSQMYRQKNPDGTISGGPMYYLDLGLKSIKLGPLGKVLGIIYALMVMGGSFGGGNMFQSNQAFEALSGAFGIDPGKAPVFGVILAILVALVIIGGIRRIGAATSRIVPAMVAIYVGASLFIIVTHLTEVPGVLALIFKMAFTENAAYGGLVGVLVWGVKRASFSSEAGLGSSAIAHAAAKTDEPVREGLVAMIEPFVDTIVVCLMTATVVIITGAWNDPAIPQEAGVALTNAAFATVIGWFPYVLAICVLLFAYSTMISWAYYGERGWMYLVNHFGGRGAQTLIIYRIIFVGFVFVGAVSKLDSVLLFSDLMILSMAFPNIVGSIILAPKVREVVRAYFAKLTPSTISS